MMSAAFQPRDRDVQSMFDRIAGRYDLLNHVISFRLDTRWRKQAIRSLLTTANPLILDLGTGTGDLAYEAAKIAGAKARIVGLDISLQMLRFAQQKRTNAPHGVSTHFIQASALAAPLRSGGFDGAMTAFVLRNVSDLPRFFAEAVRLLKPGGRFVSLDMYPPAGGWFRVLYACYFFCLMPFIAGLLSHDRKAYQYLSDSVRQFHAPETVARLMEQAGFVEVKTEKFLHGAVCMHVAKKSAPSALL
ncbi:MAG: ubiquinone/menaquinone biosynthesis methyltransferase [Deltaproteobacteria bacterium]|nr:ubiquinone/menaquinone biosynthesis methyltransferase [Deltaproteobacteria bacterium]